MFQKNYSVLMAGLARGLLKRYDLEKEAQATLDVFTSKNIKQWVRLKKKPIPKKEKC